MADDLTERVARALLDDGAWCGDCGSERGASCEDCRGTCKAYAAVALAVVADNADGIAGVLRDHRWAPMPDAIALCSCGTSAMVRALNEAPLWHERHQAAMVATHIRGGA